MIDHAPVAPKPFTSEDAADAILFALCQRLRADPDELSALRDIVLAAIKRTAPTLNPTHQIAPPTGHGQIGGWSPSEGFRVINTVNDGHDYGFWSLDGRHYRRSDWAAWFFLPPDPAEAYREQIRDEDRQSDVAARNP